MAETGLQRWRQPAVAEPPVCEEKMRRWREQETRVHSQPTARMNYWERSEKDQQWRVRHAKKVARRRTIQDLNYNLRVLLFGLGCVAIGGVITAAVIWDFNWGIISGFLLVRLLRLLD